MAHQKVKSTKQIKLDMAEVEFMQNAIDKTIKETSKGISLQSGVLKSKTFSTGYGIDLTLIATGMTSGYVGVFIGKAINSLGQIIELFDPDGATYVESEVPDGSTWYNVVARPTVSTKKEGIITLTAGSKAVTGKGTKFTELYGKTDTDWRGHYIYVDSNPDAGNNGKHEIDSITDDTNLTLVNNVLANEVDIEWYLAGSFYESDPADPTAHTRVKCDIVLTNTAQDGDIILGRAWRNGATVKCVSAVNKELFITKSGGDRGVGFVLPYHENSASWPGTGASSDSYTVGNSKYGNLFFRNDVDYKQGFFFCYDGADADKLKVKTSDEMTKMNVLSVLAATTISTTAHADSFPSIIKIPFESVEIICGYRKTNTKQAVYWQKATDADDYASWAAAELIYEDVATHVKAFDFHYSEKTMRLYLVTGMDGGDIELHYSNDFGDTWTTQAAVIASGVTTRDIVCRECPETGNIYFVCGANGGPQCYTGRFTHNSVADTYSAASLKQFFDSYESLSLQSASLEIINGVLHYFILDEKSGGAWMRVITATSDGLKRGITEDTILMTAGLNNGYIKTNLCKETGRVFITLYDDTATQTFGFTLLPTITNANTSFF